MTPTHSSFAIYTQNIPPPPRKKCLIKTPNHHYFPQQIWPPTHPLLPPVHLAKKKIMTHSWFVYFIRLPLFQGAYGGYIIPLLTLLEVDPNKCKIRPSLQGTGNYTLYMYRKLLMLSHLRMVRWSIKSVKVNVSIHRPKTKVRIHIATEFEKCHKNYSYVKFDWVKVN